MSLKFKLNLIMSFNTIFRKPSCNQQDIQILYMGAIWIILVQLQETFRGFETCHFMLKEKQFYGQSTVNVKRSVLNL